MKNREISSNKQKLDYLFTKITAFSGDTYLESHWARYLCILVSGFLETSVRIIYREYAKKKATPEVANFVEEKLKNFQNPNMDKILQLTGGFSKEWASELRFQTDGELKAAVESISNNRNQIAHGVSVGITYSQIKSYYDRAIKVIELIENQCNP
jgi:hydroxylamine reductase (hybrid-cluster protein)